MLKTINGGLNWTQQLNNTYRPLKLFFINNDTGWVGTNDYKLYKTINSGQSWGLQHTFTNPGILSIYFINRDTGWITGGGGVSQTIDGGNNWTIISSNGGGFTMQFLNQLVAFDGNIDNMINKTTNSGHNWFVQSTPIYDNSSIAFSDTVRGWAGGTGIVHTTDGGGPAGIVKIGNEIPSTFRLYQNYPNPFNPNTNISYELRVTSYVTLSLFDVTGKRVIDLVNQRQRGGKYEVDFSGNNLSSGVYFYQLTISNEQYTVVYRETMKMVLIK